MLGDLHDCDVMLPRIEDQIVTLRSEDAAAVRELAADADDLDPELSARAPHRTAYRGLEVLAVHVARPPQPPVRPLRRPLARDRLLGRLARGSSGRSTGRSPRRGGAATPAAAPRTRPRSSPPPRSPAARPPSAPAAPPSSSPTRAAPRGRRSMRRPLAVAALVFAGAVAGVPAAFAEPAPGAPGLGDSFFPGAGNGGYDVGHYGLDLRYDPSDRILHATATIESTATHDLSSFNLDYDGPRVAAVSVAGAPAEFARDGRELIVTPAAAIIGGTAFTDGRRVLRPAAPDHRRRRLEGGLVRDRGRRARDPGAARSDLLVPVERHPARQGELRRLDHRAEDAEGDLERRPRRAPPPRPADDLELARGRADGHLPRHRRDRPLQARPAQGRRAWRR